jgi:hypothetical protein
MDPERPAPHVIMVHRFDLFKAPKLELEATVEDRAVELPPKVEEAIEEAADGMQERATTGSLEEF